MKFKQIDAAVFDMDGVLWRGEQPLDGLLELFDWLEESQTPYMLATNNSSKTPADYVAKLARMGVENVPEERIITAAIATADYLKAEYRAGTPVYVLGGKGIRIALEDAGFDINSAPDEDVELVVAGIDFDLTYEKLKQATMAIRNGARFIGTNGDKTFPMPDGLAPGAGSLLAALSAATDTEPTIIGKPNAPMFETALQRLGIDKPETVVMVGDRLNTDIEGAQAVGMKTILLLTGVTTPEMMLEAQAEIWADLALENLSELLRAWAGDDWWVMKRRERRQR